MNDPTNSASKALEAAREVMTRRRAALRMLATSDPSAKIDIAETIMREDADILRRLAK
jgi:hypothetical protein